MRCYFFTDKRNKIVQIALLSSFILGGSVAVSALWRVLFMRDGMVNQIIGIVGIPPLGLVNIANLALLTLSLLQVWQFGSAMVIFSSVETDTERDF